MTDTSTTSTPTAVKKLIYGLPFLKTSMKTERRTGAFTIAELIVVIAILAVLSVVGFFSLS